LLVAEHPSSWTDIRPRIEESPGIGRPVALALSDERCGSSLEAVADERQLGELYEWLSGLLSPEADPPDAVGTGYVSRESQAIRWRDGILTTIADRGSDDALLVLGGLRER